MNIYVATIDRSRLKDLKSLLREVQQVFGQRAIYLEIEPVDTFLVTDPSEEHVEHHLLAKMIKVFSLPFF